MRKTKNWFSPFGWGGVGGAPSLLGGCWVGGGRGGGGGGGGGSGGSGLASVAQLRSDMATPIPTGGSTPEPTIVVRAVVRDTTVATPRVEVEIRPVGTDFQGQPNATSAATPRGDTALVQVSGLQDNTGYHWQARMEGDTAWQPYGGNPESAADLRVALPVATNHLEFTQDPTTITAGGVMDPVKVSLKDGQGNVITGFTGNVHLEIAPNANPGGDNLARDANAVAGVATFSTVSLTKAGSGYRLEATADGVAGVTSGSFGIKAEIADHPKYLVQPTNTTPNRPITPAVRVAILDRYDNVADSFTGPVYMEWGNNPTGAALKGTGTTRNATLAIDASRATSIDRLGVGYTLLVSAASVHALTSESFSVLVSLPAPPRTGVTP